MDRLPGAKGPHPNRVAAPIEEAILAHALEYPTHGAQRVSDELMLKGIQVSASGVRGVWIRNDLSELAPPAAEAGRDSPEADR